MKADKLSNFESRLTDLKYDTFLAIFKYLKDIPGHIIYLNDDKSENICLTNQRKVLYSTSAKNFSIYDELSSIDSLLEILEKIENKLNLEN